MSTGSRNCFVAATVMCLFVVVFGVFMAAPKMMCGGLLTVWGCVFLFLGLSNSGREVSRGTLPMAGVVLAAGVSTVLFSSDWGAAGTCDAFVCIEVANRTDGSPLSGATVLVTSGGELQASAVSNQRGHATCAVRIPYEWRYRLIGSSGVAKLDQTMVSVEGGEAISVAKMRGTYSYGPEICSGPVFVYIPIPVRRSVELDHSHVEK